MLKEGLMAVMSAGLAVGASGCASVAARQSQTAKSNTQVVLAFEAMVFNKHQVQEGFDKYVGPTYKQHNPLVPDGKDGAVKALSYMLGTLFPNARTIVKRTVAEGDLVAVHVLWEQKPGETRGGEAIIDIYRLQSGKIVEHWDVVQAVPEKSANENTMF